MDHRPTAPLFPKIQCTHEMFLSLETTQNMVYAIRFPTLILFLNDRNLYMTLHIYLFCSDDRRSLVGLVHVIWFSDWDSSIYFMLFVKPCSCCYQGTKAMAECAQSSISAQSIMEAATQKHHAPQF